MANYRTVSLSFWSDPFVEGLTAEEKIVFLYLFTNSHVNNLGISEVTTRKISFETGATIESIDSLLEKAARSNKVYTDGNKILCVNFIKNQTHTNKSLSINNNVVKNLQDLFLEAPAKLAAVLQKAYPEIFSDCIKPLDSPNLNEKHDSREGEAPIKPLGSPYQHPTKPLGSPLQAPSSNGEAPTKPLPSPSKEGEGEGDREREGDKEGEGVGEGDGNASAGDACPPSKKEPRKKRGEYQHVRLSDTELHRLEDEYGKNVVKYAIKAVDEYCEQNGKRYKNYNLAIRNWGIERGRKLYEQLEPDAAAEEAKSPLEKEIEDFYRLERSTWFETFDTPEIIAAKQKIIDEQLDPWRKRFAERGITNL